MEADATPQQILQYAIKHKNDIKTSSYKLTPEMTAIRVEPRNWKDRDTIENAFVRTNLRKGLTFIVKQTGQGTQVVVANKGLRWFEELDPQHLNYETVSRKSAVERERKQFVKVLEDSLRPIAVTSVEIIDGEHIEVSFSCGFWVFCGANTEVFVADLSTLQVFGPTLFTTVVAKRWRDYLSNLSPEKQKQLQNALERFTIIGHFADSNINQRICFYSDVELRFSAMVDKTSHLQCVPPQEAQAFFRKFGISYCALETVVCDDFRTTLKKLSAQMKSSLKGAGHTVYVVSGNGKDPRVVWMWKLHSLEYKVLEKLKQKLLLFVPFSSQGPDFYMNQFMNDLDDFAKIFDLDYLTYKKIAGSAFERADSCSSEIYPLLRTQFRTFINKLDSKFCQPNEMQPKQAPKVGGSDISIMRDLKNFELDDVSEFDYSNLHRYGWDTSTINDFTSKRIIVYMPFSIPASRSSRFFEQLKQTQKDIHIQLVDSNEASKEAMSIVKQSQDMKPKSLRQQIPYPVRSNPFAKSKPKPKKPRKEIPVVIYKSEYDGDYDLDQESIFDIKRAPRQFRKPRINYDNIQSNHKYLSHYWLYNKAYRQAAFLYNNKVLELLQRLEESPSSKCILVLNKNHSPNNMFQAVNNIRMAVGNRAKIVAALPVCREPFVAEDFYFPFSVSYLCTCIIRAAERQGHATLQGDRLHKGGVVATIFSRFKGFHFQKENLPHSLDFIQQYPTHNDNLQVPPGIEKKLAKLFQGIDDDRYEQDGRFDDVISEILVNLKLNEPDEESILGKAKDNINWLFENYNNLKRLWPEKYASI